MTSIQLEPLYDKKIVCLFCESEFTSKQVRSSATRMIKQDSDYCTYYKGENPLYYDVFVCPHCGFAFTGSFARLTPVKKEILKKEYFNKLPSIPDLCQQREITEALHAYKWAALTSYLVNEKSIITANLFLRIAWLYRYQNKPEKEKHYLQIALRFYEDAYARGNFEEIIDEHQLLFLIGELSIRIDQFQKAAKIFSMLLADESVPRKIRVRTTESWQQYKTRNKDKNERKAPVL